MARTQEQKYNDEHIEYDGIDLLPMGYMHTALGAYALGDCTGQTVLDLGGGSGLHARTAVDQGTARVDVVDLSKGMMENGIANEGKLGRKDRIRWYEGDISKSLGGIPLDEAYDVTMVNWTFDHAESMEALEGMWENVRKYTKVGGRLISIRMTNPFKLGARKQYGVTISDQEPIPGGAKYVYTAHTDPEFSCPAATMEASWDLDQAKAMAKRYGFGSFEVVPAQEMQCAKDDPELWALHLEHPGFVCVTAVRES